MKALLTYIKEALLTEGGHAVECQPVPAPIALDVFNEVVEKIHSKYTDLDIVSIGSVGKKKEGDFNGDIDTAVKIDSMGEMVSILNEVFPDIEIATPKGKTVSIGFPYDIKGHKGVAQVDFMICSDTKWAQFFWHSPNFINGESKYKGGAAGDLLAVTISEIPVEDAENEYYEDGQLKKKWKHTLNSEGVFRQLLDYTGKKGPVKTPKRPKEFQTLLAKDEDSVITFIFGDRLDKNNISHNIIYSAESLWAAIHNPKLFKWQEVVPTIEQRYWDENAEKWGLKREDFKTK